MANIRFLDKPCNTHPYVFWCSTKEQVDPLPKCTYGKKANMITVNAITSAGKPVLFSMKKTVYTKLQKIVVWSKFSFWKRVWLTITGQKKGFINDR